MTDVWVLTRYQGDPQKLDSKGAYTKPEKAKAAAEKDNGKPLTWKDTAADPDYPTAYVGWSEPPSGWVIDTIYEISQLEVDPE